MFSKTRGSIVKVCGMPYEKQVILADVNIPYKFSIDRYSDILFFCINADEYSVQSFHSVVLDLSTGLPYVIPDIRNGFASATDHTIGTVYLGGSDGIFKYNSITRNIETPALVHGVDIMDMYFREKLYFVETRNQNLFVFKDHKKTIVEEIRDQLIQHFVVDKNNDIIFINPAGLFSLPKGGKSAVLLDESPINFRGAATDIFGVAHFVARDGIYALHTETKQLVKIMALTNGCGLAFDKDNNIVYGDERSVVKMIPIIK